MFLPSRLLFVFTQKKTSDIIKKLSLNILFKCNRVDKLHPNNHPNSKITEHFFETEVITYKILTMISQEGEEVDLQPFVLCQGSVEVWLRVLLDTVLGTVHKIVKRAWQNLGDR